MIWFQQQYPTIPWDYKAGERETDRQNNNKTSVVNDSAINLITTNGPSSIVQ